MRYERFRRSHPLHVTVVPPTALGIDSRLVQFSEPWTGLRKAAWRTQSPGLCGREVPETDQRCAGVLERKTA